MRLQKSDPILNMGIDVMRPAFNFEAKYRVTMLTKEEWTRGFGTPPAVKGARLVYRRVQDAVGGWRGLGSESMGILREGGPVSV